MRHTPHALARESPGRGFPSGLGKWGWLRARQPRPAQQSPWSRHPCTWGKHQTPFLLRGHHHHGNSIHFIWPSSALRMARPGWLPSCTGVSLAAAAGLWGTALLLSISSLSAVRIWSLVMKKPCHWRRVLRHWQWAAARETFPRGSMLPLVPPVNPLPAPLNLEGCPCLILCGVSLLCHLQNALGPA